MTTKPLHLDVHNQIESAHTLASKFYTDPTILDAERARIFRSTWQLVGTLSTPCGELNGAKRTIAGAVEQHRADRGIHCPCPQQGRHGDDHIERDGVERFRPVQRDVPQRTEFANQNVAVLNNRSVHRPTRLLATMSRMISLVPSRIWCTRKSRTIFSMPYSAR